MGITVTSITLRDTQRQEFNTARRLERHQTAKAAGDLWGGGNADAWFLDALLERLAPRLPKRIFSQGAADPPGPGDLTPEQCRELARALQAATAEDVIACYAPINGSDPAPGLELAATIATLALRAAAVDGGLAVY